MGRPAFEPLDKDIREMSAEEVRAACRYRTKDQFVPRYVSYALAWALAKQVNERPETWTFQGNSRDLYHAELEPIFARLRPDEWARDPTVDLSDALSELVFERKVVTYRQLQITDPNWEDRRIGGMRPEVVVFAEKQGLIRLLRRIHRSEDVTVLVLGGYPHGPTAEYTATDVRRAMEAAGRAGAKVRLIGLVDHDPFGPDIARVFRSMLEQAGIGETTLELPFGPAVATPEERKWGRVPIPRPGRAQELRRISEWLAATGGVDGEPFGLSLEAMDWRRLEELVRQRVRDG